MDKKADQQKETCQAQGPCPRPRPDGDRREQEQDKRSVEKEKSGRGDNGDYQGDVQPSPEPGVSCTGKQKADRRANRSQSAPVFEPWRFRDPRHSSTQSLLPSDKLRYAPGSGVAPEDVSSRICSLDSARPEGGRPNDAGKDNVGGVATRHLRRRLLVVYIHGFMGDTTSFRSFPAHVHGYLSQRLSDTHVVHTKIYPRYKTYRKLRFAAAEFSRWLEPNVDDITDVVLVGHSMGGMTAADVVLLPGLKNLSQKPLRRCILGTISCDSPFLGLNPRIIIAGIKSLLLPNRENNGRQSRPKNPTTPPTSAPGPPVPHPIVADHAGHSKNVEASATSSHTMNTTAESVDLLQSSAASVFSDPNFNPSFENDPQHSIRGFWAGLFHFYKKHHYRPDCIAGASLRHIFQHFQYAWCLIDWGQLTRRYNRTRVLDKEGNLFGSRVRWVNYYTVCSGRNGAEDAAKIIREEQGLRGALVRAMDTLKFGKKPTKQPTGAVGDQGQQLRARNGQASATKNQHTTEQSPVPPSHAQQCADGTVESVLYWLNNSSSASSLDTFEPESVANNRKRRLLPSQLPSDPDLRRQASPSSSVGQKDAMESPKSIGSGASRSQTPSQRSPLETQTSTSEVRQLKQELELRLEAEMRLAEQEFLGHEHPGMFGENEHSCCDLCDRPQITLPSLPPNNTPSSPGPQRECGGGKRSEGLRNFCLVPFSIPQKPNATVDSGGGGGGGGDSKDPDPCWVKIDMGDVDEVAAHCGLFRESGSHYQGFLMDFCERIASWVEEDMASKRRRDVG